MFSEQLQVHQSLPGPSVDQQFCTSINFIDFLGTKSKGDRDAIRRGFPRNGCTKITSHGACADDSFADPNVEAIDEPKKECPEEPQVDAPNNYFDGKACFKTLSRRWNWTEQGWRDEKRQ